MRLVLRAKLMVSYLVMVLFLVVVAAVGVRSSNQTEARYVDLVDRRDKIELADKDLHWGIDTAAMNFGWYVITGETEYLGDLTEAQKKMQTTLDFLRQNVITEKGKALVASVAEANDRYWTVMKEATAKIQGNGKGGHQLTPKEMAELSAMVLPANDPLDKVVSELSNYQRSASESARAQVSQDQNQSVGLMIGTGGAAALLALLLGWLLSAGISRPVRRITMAAQQVANGDFRLGEIKASTRDEVGDLGQAFNTMVANVKALVAEIISATANVASSAEQLSQASGQTAAASQQVAQAISGVAAGAGEQSKGTDRAAQITAELKQAIVQVASGAQEQSRQVQTLAMTADKLSRDLTGLVGTMERIRGVAAENGASASAGAKVVNQTTEGMERIRQAVEEATARLADLNQASGQIGQITQVIADIADQTNLLALNAAIEAARAGDHGKGFAVVAEEVRKLAERSASSAREINGLVAGIQNGTGNLVKAMERTNGEVKAGTELAHQAALTLGEVAEKAVQTVSAVAEAAKVASDNAQAAEESTRAINSVAAIVEENTAATEEMTAGAEQVEGIVGQVAKLAEDNAAATEEISASVEEMSASVEEVAASAESLKAIAGGLKRAAERFKV